MRSEQKYIRKELFEFYPQRYTKATPMTNPPRKKSDDERKSSPVSGLDGYALSPFASRMTASLDDHPTRQVMGILEESLHAQNSLEETAILLGVTLPHLREWISRHYGGFTPDEVEKDLQSYGKAKFFLAIWRGVKKNDRQCIKILADRFYESPRTNRLPRRDVEIEVEAAEADLDIPHNGR